jgi:hypothetical protein
MKARRDWTDSDESRWNYQREMLFEQITFLNQVLEVLERKSTSKEPQKEAPETPYQRPYPYPAIEGTPAETPIATASQPLCQPTLRGRAKTINLLSSILTTKRQEFINLGISKYQTTSKPEQEGDSNDEHQLE